MNEIDLDEYLHQLEFDAENSPRFKVGDRVEVYSSHDIERHMGTAMIQKANWYAVKESWVYQLVANDGTFNGSVRSCDLEPEGVFREKVLPFTLVRGGKK